MKTSAILASFVIMLLGGLAGIVRADAAPSKETPAMEEPYPAAQLHNKRIRVNIYLPDAKSGYYRGPRFEWASMIGPVNVGNHTFYGEWLGKHNPELNDDAIGPAEEFGMQEPLGYKDAQPGEPFLKIGVGRIERQAEESYQFWKMYKILQPLSWKVEQTQDQVIFSTEEKRLRGYAYQYSRKIELLEDATSGIPRSPPGFSITHTLKNTGKKPVHTNWYCHNFTIIDHLPIGKDYSLEFAIEPQAQTSPKELTNYDGKMVTLTGSIPDCISGGFGNWTDNPADNAITITNAKVNSAVEITGDFALQRIGFFATNSTICPEPFMTIDLLPGQSRTWTTRYRFHVPDQK